MSHTTTGEQVTFIHNGDYSGDIKIIHDNGKKLSVPFSDIKMLVANYVRDSQIAALEQAEDDEILLVPVDYE